MAPLTSSFLIYIPDDAPSVYREFWHCWQQEDFFGAHEVLEDLWRISIGEKKQFYNGLIHAAIAIYQHRRGNAVGAARQAVRMQAKLATIPPEFYGVRIDNLIRVVETEIAPSLQHLNDAQKAQLKILRDRLKEKFAQP